MPKGKNNKNGNNPNPPDEDDDEDGGDDEAPLSRGEVAKMINSAVSGQLARKLPAAIEAGVSPVLKKLEEMGGAGKKPDDEEPEDDDEQPTKKGKGKPDPATAKLSKQLNDMQRKLQERDEQLAKEAEARKASKIETTLGQALTELGVDKNRIRGALAIHKSGAIVDDEGNVVFRVKRDGYDEDLAPADALKEWAGTDEGKSYIAPTGSSGGAGARAPRQTGAARKPAGGTPEAKAEKVAQAKTELLQAVGQLTAGGSISIE
jgi:hypothetical protein